MGTLYDVKHGDSKPDQRVAEAQDGADQPELRREAGKEGEVTQADFDASYQEHKGLGPLRDLQGLVAF